MNDQNHSVVLTALGSGSSGNSFVLQYRGASLVVDAGFSRRELLRRLELVRIDPESILAVLLTHDHDDHVKGCRVFCDELNIPLCVSGRTAEYLRPRLKLPRKVMEFDPGVAFVVGEFSVLPFQVRHDAIDPVGFRLGCGDCEVGFATDIGFLTTLAQQRLADCDALVLESNYDQQMLLNSQRKINLKRRIMSQNGHMNNLDALAALETLLTKRTKLLFLAHISGECNRYELVEELGGRKLRELAREDIHFAVLRQDAPYPPVCISVETKKEPPPVVAMDCLGEMFQFDLFDFAVSK